MKRKELQLPTMENRIAEVSVRSMISLHSEGKTRAIVDSELS